MKKEQSSFRSLRGQSALEYLVTYGWAILAIVVIAALLLSFNVFNPGAIAGSKQVTGFSAFTVTDYKVNTTGIYVKVGNNLGSTVTVTSVASAANGCTTGVLTTSLPANAKVLFNSTTSCGATITGATAGNEYTITDLTIAYTQDGIPHADIGGLKGKVEAA